MKTMSKQELEYIYRNNSNDRAAEVLGVSIPTMLKLLKENGVEFKGQGGHNHDPKIRVVD